MSRVFLTLSVLALFACITPVSSAQERVAYTTVEEAGVDFTIQGEYVGGMKQGGLFRTRVGLQVIARGESKFEAVLLSGGLPGAGWDGSEKVTLAGSSSNGFTNLTNDENGIRVSIIGDTAIVHDEATESAIGKLRRIERVSPSLGLEPPEEAVVVFDGSNTDQFEDGAQMTDDGLLMQGALLGFGVGDFRLHFEFKTPFMPNSVGQSRGNSGVYIQRRYEVQVLDSFGLDGVQNECAALYRQKAPDVNMCFPPLQWQTYDIYFRAARWSEAGEKTESARITVYHNGVPVHTNYEIIAKTGAGQPEAPTKMPILLQNHSDPVRYRNIWLIHADDSMFEEATPAEREGLLKRFRRRT
ncbi:MAG: DUF1080 domain-containing protein [Pirellulaceae bacterium]